MLIFADIKLQILTYSYCNVPIFGEFFWQFLSAKLAYCWEHDNQRLCIDLVSNYLVRSDCRMLRQLFILAFVALNTPTPTNSICCPCGGNSKCGDGTACGNLFGNYYCATGSCNLMGCDCAGKCRTSSRASKADQASTSDHTKEVSQCHIPSSETM